MVQHPRAALKVMLLEVNVGEMAVEVEPSHQYSVPLCYSVTDDSRRAVWQNGICHGSEYEAKMCA